MHMRTRARQAMVTEIRKTTNFWAHFFYNMFLRILVKNPIHWYYHFLLISLFQVG